MSMVLNAFASEEELRAAESSLRASGAQSTCNPYPMNDSERAEYFAKKNDGILRYVHAWNAWFIWNGNRWARDESGEVFRKAQELPKQLSSDALELIDRELWKKANGAAIRAGDNQKIKATVDLARHKLNIATPAKQFDSEPMLLGVQNGVVDLRTGIFRASRKEDLITKQAGTHYDESALCPTWEKFLNRVLNGESELISFIRRAVGYSLTGLTKEQVLFFLYGTGRNGKSTFTETLQRLIGDYAQRAPAALFIADRNGREPEKEIARLVGCRFVVGSEIEEGAKMAESRVKDLTGQDTLVGRNLYSPPFEFSPTHKLWIFGNHKPQIRGNDKGIWRRMRLIPFQVQLSENEVDPNLPAKLLQELPGILNWAIQGCLEWQKAGLAAPKIVREATNEYREEEDELAEFIEESCEKKGRVERVQLFQAYTLWAVTSGIRYPMSTRQFAKKLRERGYKDHKTDSGYVWIWNGLSLRNDSHVDESSGGVGARACQSAATSGDAGTRR